MMGAAGRDKQQTPGGRIVVPCSQVDEPRIRIHPLAGEEVLVGDRGFDFAGQKGFRFDYMLTRKVDNVQLAGLGYGAVAEGELFAIVYMAPQLAFFPRHKERVEQMAAAVRLKD